LRDQPDNREAHFTIFKESLLQNDKPFVVLSGNAETRFEQAKKIIVELDKAKEMGFSSHDFVQIYERGISLETINSHLNVFRLGISKAVLVRPATKNDGIIKLSSEDEFQQFSDYFDQRKNQVDIEKVCSCIGSSK
jgi:hypothetical protein